MDNNEDWQRMMEIYGLAPPKFSPGAPGAPTEPPPFDNSAPPAPAGNYAPPPPRPGPDQMATMGMDPIPPGTGQDIADQLSMIALSPKRKGHRRHGDRSLMAADDYDLGGGRRR